MEQKEQPMLNSNRPPSKPRRGLFQKCAAKTSALEWYFSAEVEPWAPAIGGQNATGTASVPRAYNQRMRFLPALVVVLATCVTLYMWWMAESGARQLESELATAIATDVHAGQFSHGDRDLSATAIPSTIINEQLQDVTFLGQVMSAQVERTVIEPQGEPYRLRQRRFYQVTDKGWVHIPPNSAYLGSWDMLQTRFFSISYYAMDEVAVKAVAGALDDTYAALRQDYGLPPAPQRVSVTLLTDLPQARSACYRPYHVCIPSPALTALPLDVADHELLRLWLVNALALQLTREWNVGERSPYEWRYVNSILPRIQTRRHSASLQAWHMDLVGWLHGISGRGVRPDGETLAHELTTLCELHSVRSQLTFLANTSGTGLCTASTKRELSFLAHYTPPARLGDLHMPDPDLSADPIDWTEALNVEVLFDFVTAAYGREALPALLAGFEDHATWQTLIPAVFEISVEGFERDWQQYLQTLQ